MKQLKVLFTVLCALVITAVNAQKKTWDFVAFDEQKSTLVSYGGVENWHLQAPNDGSTIGVTAYEYMHEKCILLAVRNSTTNVQELRLTSDFTLQGKVRQIILKAGGWLQFIAYLMPNNMMKESNRNTSGSWDEYVIDFEEPVELDGPLQLFLVTASSVALQSLTIVMGDGDDSVTSTFNAWQNPQPTSDGGIYGMMRTNESNDWEGFLNNTDVSVQYTSIGSETGSGTSCIMTYLQNGNYFLNMSNNFPYEGTVEKIIVRAAGNLMGIEAVISEGYSTDAYHAGTQAWSTAEFTDYVIWCTNCPEFEEAAIQLTIYGEGAMYIHSVKIVRHENLPELPSGKCGDNLEWALEYLPGETTDDHDNNTSIPAVKLVITGTGDMYDYQSEYAESPNAAPWAKYKWNITHVDLSDDITHIGAYSFPRYWNLNIYDPLPSQLHSIGAWAFYNIYIGRELRIPDGVISVGAGAFEAVNGVTDIYIPAGLTDIGSEGFAGMYNAEYFHVDAENPVFTDEGYALSNRQTKTLIASTRKSEIPDWIETIGPRGANNVYRETITLPDGLKSIGQYAFWYAKITEIRIPNSVETISSYVFQGCSSLLTVYIGKGVKSIGRDAFEYCRNILDIYCEADPEHLAWSYGNYENQAFMADGKTLMHVRAEDLETWQTKFDFLNVTFVGDLATGIEPIYDMKTIDVESLQSEDLSDNTVDNVYYNLNPERGCFYQDGGLVIGQSTDMSAIGNGTPGSAEVAENFNGIILKVMGKGTITIDSRVFGRDLRLAVRIGNGTPVISPDWDRRDRQISYNVSQETYVYIYAVGQGALVRAFGNSEPEVGDDYVAIYSITIEPEAYDPDSINAIDNNDSPRDSATYDLNGRRLFAPRKGFNIIRLSDGTSRKVLIK